jgi:hypothetical protein
LLATGHPLSVVPPSIQNLLDLVVNPVPGWRGITPTWFGVACRIGRATLWLPIQENPGAFRSFSLLALLPQQELPDAPPYVYLGAQFLLEHQVQVALDGASPVSGRLVIP